ncbi:DMT family transporter [Mailhella massiliensis]|uniref:DMT family transporter n=1 Tax=Mailhella massiliensis TaxID=1903261 RepID=UPI00097CE83C|nr:multidrug efflux SMR transporter [Mailhella massiliensis]
MRGALTTYGLLLLAILAETFATSSLNASKQFTRLVPTLCCIAGYIVSFYTFSHVLKTMPVGIAYAIWCALGIVLISAVGVFYFRQHLDLPAYIGLGLIIAGVVVINVFSDAVKH